MKSSGGLYKEPKGEKSMGETVRNGDGVELTINNSTVETNETGLGNQQLSLDQPVIQKSINTRLDFGT